MRVILIYVVMAISTVLIACNKSSYPYDTAIVAMLDETDKMPTYPTAQSLLSPFKLADDPWQGGIQIKLVGITDKDVNTTLTVSLEKEDRLTGNLTIRRAKVQRFISDLQNGINAFTTRNCGHSIIFRTIAGQAAQLADNPAHNRFLVVYSDLIENSEISFYNPQTLALLQKSPGMIEKQLEATDPLPSLTGIHVWFLFAPNSYKQNNVYMPIARFYESVYKAHHADVHIATQFSLP